MIRILFVCHGNICRSPMAEFVMKDLVCKKGLENQFEIASAATSRYEHGRGVPQSTEKAAEYYRRGAEAGHPGCQHSYGCYLMRGDFLKKDKKQAFEWFLKSAEQGYGLAMRDVGRCYQFGDGCMGNMKTAVEWYEKALQVIDDPELARKTQLFRAIGENRPDWDQDYSGTDEFEEYDPEEEQRQRAEEWEQKYGKYVEKKPKIVIKGSKFVFTGILIEDWASVLEKLYAKGGLERSAVSGKTDYLVVDPRGFGESKVKAALDQRAKGKNVKIILFDDFMKALGK